MPLQEVCQLSGFIHKKHKPLICELLYIIFFLATLSQLFFWGFLFSKLAFFKDKITDENLKKQANPVSIVICAHKKIYPVF